VKPVLAAAAVADKRQSKPALIAARGLSKTYSTSTGEVVALKNLDFDIHDGEFVSVVARAAAASPHC